VVDVFTCIRNHVRTETAGRIAIRRLRRLHRFKMEQQLALAERFLKTFHPVDKVSNLHWSIRALGNHSTSLRSRRREG